MLGDLLIDDGVFEALLSDSNLLPPSGLFNYGAVRGQLSLVQPLFLHRHAKCSHPLDRVYALMSLVTTEYNHNFQIDYSMSETKLYEQVATIALARSDCTEGYHDHHQYDYYQSREQRLLTFAAATCLKGEAHLEVPGSLKEFSWVPNWSRRVNYTCPEHEQAVEHTMRSVQTPAWEEKYLIFVQKGCVRLTGLLMYLCLPLRVHQDGSCVSCNTFSHPRFRFSAAFEQKLAVAARERCPLYIPMIEGNSPVMFVLRRTEALLGNQYPIHVLDYCFFESELPKSIEKQPCPNGSIEFGTMVIR